VVERLKLSELVVALAGCAQRVGGADGLAVGVIQEGGGLLGGARAASDGFQTIEAVDDALGGQGDMACAVAHLLADAVAHAVERVLMQVASVAHASLYYQIHSAWRSIYKGWRLIWHEK
jgi:hypothetical protein